MLSCACISVHTLLLLLEIHISPFTLMDLRFRQAGPHTPAQALPCLHSFSKDSLALGKVLGRQTWKQMLPKEAHSLVKEREKYWDNQNLVWKCYNRGRPKELWQWRRFPGGNNSRVKSCRTFATIWHSFNKHLLSTYHTPGSKSWSPRRSSQAPAFKELSL